MCEDCKIVYKAFNGKEFDSEEECNRYNMQPRVYIVTFFGNNIKAIYSNEEDAIEHCSKYEKLYSYSVEPVIINDSHKTVQERVTNINSKTSFWDKMKGKLCKQL